MTLIRCATGGAWNEMMSDLARQRTVIFQCSYDDFDYQEYLANGKETNGCGTPASLFFFILFIFMVPLVFLNLFIATMRSSCLS